MIYTSKDWEYYTQRFTRLSHGLDQSLADLNSAIVENDQQSELVKKMVAQDVSGLQSALADIERSHHDRVGRVGSDGMDLAVCVDRDYRNIEYKIEITLQQLNLIIKRRH